MAILSAIFSLLAKKIGDLLQALFGWSVTALFGRLTSKKQIAVSIALVLSILWPVFVVGLAFPKAAAYVVAFLPIQNWIGEKALRGIWIGLAIAAPLIVGGITHVVAPNRKGGIVRSLLHGYPLALGFALSFLITVVTVPIVKIASTVRGYTDQHVYVQARRDRYIATLHRLAEACVMAGIVPETKPVPLSMALSTRVLKALSSGAVAPFLAEDPQMLEARGLEIFLYPSDLLMRGKPKIVARVRAAMTRTALYRDAYLVEAPRAQELQDEVGESWELMVSRGEAHRPASDRVTKRLRDISHEIDTADIPFDDWAMLDGIVLRLASSVGASSSSDEDIVFADPRKNRSQRSIQSSKETAR